VSTNVSVVKLDSSEGNNLKDRVIAGVEEAMELARWREHISQGADVSLKLNLTLDILLPGANTSPWVTRGVIETIHDYVGDIYLVDCDQLLFSADKAFRTSCIEPIAGDYNKVIWHNLSKNEYRPIKVEESKNMKTLNVPEVFYYTEAITVPVMKTHFRSVISGALKNQYGCLDRFRHNYHSFLSEIIYLINLHVNPRFAVMDATVSMEGDGPKSGHPKVTDLVLASPDIVALDTIAAKLMGFDPREIEHLEYAAKRGLGTNKLDEIEVVGENISGLNFNFKPANKNFVAIVEAKLRESALSKTVFGTGLLDVMSIGAKWWYFLWFLYKGFSSRNTILKNSPYKNQWR